MEVKFDKLRADNPYLTALSKLASEEFNEMVKKTFNNILNDHLIGPQIRPHSDHTVYLNLVRI